MANEPPREKARRARIDLMIERYSVARERRLMRRALRLWRQAELDHQLMKFEEPRPRVH